MIDNKTTNEMEDDSERKQDNSNTPHYEPLNVLSAQTTHPGPTYEPLTTSSNLGATEQSLSDRANYENLEYKGSAKETHSTEYEGLQHREQLASDAYESITPRQ